MFALTHYYIAKKAGFSDPYTIFGATILPDLAGVEAFGWQDLHGRFYNFKKFYKDTKDKKLLNLIIGNELHLITDNLSHHINPSDYKGWAIKLSIPIAEKFNLTNQIAHNFIEIAVDIYVQEDNPDIKKPFLNILEKIDYEYITQYLGKYFNKDEKIYSLAVKNFLAIFDYRKIENSEDYADVTLDLLQKDSPNIDVKTINNLITEAKDIVKDKYVEFLDRCISQTKKSALKEL